MKITVTLAGNYNVTPFEIFKQDLDEVIMLINYYLSLSENSETELVRAPEKEKDRDFWTCL